MSPWLQAFTFVADLLLPMGAGYLLARRAGIGPDRLDPLMRFAIVSVAPVLTGLTFWGVQLAPHLAWLPVLGVVMLVLPGVVALGTARSKTAHGPLERGSYVLTSMLANRGVVGGLATYILFGEQGYAWSRLIIIFGPMIVFMIGFPLAGRYYQQHAGATVERGSWRDVVFSRNQAPVIGIGLGLTLNLIGVARPEPAAQAIPYLVHVMAWLMLLPTGAAIRLREWPQYFTGLLDVLAIKFILTPLVLAALAWALGFRGELLATVVLLAASPTAIFTVVVARAQGLNTQMAMAGFVLTTVVYLLVVFPAFLIGTMLLR